MTRMRDMASVASKRGVWWSTMEDSMGQGMDSDWGWRSL